MAETAAGAAREKRPGQGIAAMNVILGVSRWEAAGIAAESGWMEEAQSLWDSYARRVLWSRTLLATLDQVAAGSPTVATRWLNEWLKGRKARGDLNLSYRDWVLTLPEALDVEGNLMLPCKGIERLPRDLKIGSNLWLERSPIVSLPEGLDVRFSIWLRRCRDWDGRIPADARVGGRVFSDRHIQGVPLAEWRARYPLGERPDLRGA
jgi:hypothetical protein